MRQAEDRFVQDLIAAEYEEEDALEEEMAVRLQGVSETLLLTTRMKVAGVCEMLIDIEIKQRQSNQPEDDETITWLSRRFSVKMTVRVC